MKSNAHCRQQTYYNLLGLSETASGTEISKAFRLQALSLHPDRKGGGDSEEFAKAVEAYEVLADPTARAAYDSRLASGRSKQAAAAEVDGNHSTHIPDMLRGSSSHFGPCWGFDRDLPSLGDEMRFGGEAVRRRWDAQFVEHHGKFMKRPTSRQQSAKSIESPFSAHAESRDSNKQKIEGGGELPPRSKSRNSVLESSDAQSSGSLQQQTFLQPPLSASVITRVRQLRLHRRECSASPSSLVDTSVVEDQVPAKTEDSIPLYVVGESSSVTGSLPLRSIARSQTPTIAHPSKGVAMPLSDEGLRRGGGGVSEGGFTATMSYAPTQGGTKRAFLRIDQHLSPSRRAASASLKHRFQRTTGAHATRLTANACPQMVNEVPAQSLTNACPQMNEVPAQNVYQSPVGSTMPPLARGRSSAQASRKTLQLFFPEHPKENPTRLA